MPVVSSEISGSIGLLGRDYSGYFSFADSRGLAKLLYRAETDAAFYADLVARCRELRGLVDPARERESWARLLEEIA